MATSKLQTIVLFTGLWLMGNAHEQARNNQQNRTVRASTNLIAWGVTLTGLVSPQDIVCSPGRKRGKMQGIYYIKNKITGATYIGASANIDARIYQHKHSLVMGSHRNKYLQTDYNESPLGLALFQFGVLEQTSDLEAREIFWINQQEMCYNVQGWKPTKMPRMKKILKRIRDKGIERAKQNLTLQ